MKEAEIAQLAKIVDELRSRELIRDKLHRYMRGVDRRDTAALEDTFWPEARVNFGIYQGTGQEFSRSIVGWLKDGGVETTDHLLGNVLIAIEGDIANTECYLQAYHRLRQPDGTAHDCFIGGRYQDRFERRKGEWRIAERVLIYDWFRQYPDSGDFATGCMGLSNQNAIIGEAGPDLTQAISQALARLK